MNWEDLVLHPYTSDQIEDIRRWLKYNDLLMNDPNLARKLKPGYRALFYGPAGTGKTFTASLLGKQFKKEVYRIDLSQIVSKYIGETEKNLSKVFDRAEHKNWILFFDEADALFGKRTSVQSSHDKYANQEVSFLLQRVEDFNGLMILASNIKGNLDEAFLRRFHAVIHFPMPNSQERLKLWTKAIPESIPVESENILADLAQAYELSGASIINIVQYAALKALSRSNDPSQHLLTRTDLIEGVRKEFRKEDKSVL
jgi:SpoVK/Ycf46/Vps4 family AAA+-type ATPase